MNLECVVCHTGFDDPRDLVDVGPEEANGADLVCVECLNDLIKTGDVIRPVRSA